MESRKDRFNRIASKRTNDIINKIRILGNCSNKSTYEYSKEDIDKIFNTLNQELKRTKDKFSINHRSKFEL
jgi:hypothetical protein